MAKQGELAPLPKLLRNRAPKAADPEVLYRIVEKTFQGLGPSEIGRELNLSHTAIIRYKKHGDFSKMMADHLRYHISARMGEISDALFKEIKKGSVQAITLALKSVGVVDSKAPLETKDTSITVIMPGAKSPDTIITIDPSKAEIENEDEPDRAEINPEL